jgi:hypothetical protein
LFSFGPGTAVYNTQHSGGSGIGGGGAFQMLNGKINK